MAKGQYLADLTMKIGADTASLRKGLDVAKAKMNSFGNNVKKTGRNISKNISGAFTGLSSSISPQLTMITMGFKTIASTIKTSVIPSIAGMGVALGVATGGLTLAIGAIVAAFISIKSYINRTVEGTEKWSLITAKIGGYWEGIMDRVSLVGKYIWGLVTGNREMKEEASAAWGELKTLNEYAEESVAIQKEDNQLWKDKMKAIEDAKQLEYEAAELKKKAYDEEKYNASERLGFVNKAISKQKQASDLRIGIAKTEYDLQVRRNKMADSGKEDLEKENELKQVYLDALKTAEKRETTLISKKVSIVKQSEAEVAAIEKALEADKERLDILTKRMSLLTGAAGSTTKVATGGGAKASDSPFLPSEEDASKDLKKGQERIDALEEQTAEASDKEIENLEAKEQKKRAILTASFQMASGLINTLSAISEQRMAKELKAAEGNEQKQEQIRKKYAKKKKMFAIFQALINGAMGVTQLFGLPLGIANPAFFPMLGATIGLTAVQVGAIAAQKFAMGGISEGGLAMVGERGKELVNLPAGSRVHSAHDTRNMLGGGGGARVFIPDVQLRGEDIWLSFTETQRKIDNTL
jgi:hypothetical protein